MVEGDDHLKRRTEQVTMTVAERLFHTHPRIQAEMSGIYQAAFGNPKTQESGDIFSASDC